MSILLLWNDGRQCMESILCVIVESSCLITHNIAPHISSHDLPCHMTTKKYADFPSMVIFQLLLRKFWIRTWFCNCQQHLCFFHIVFKYTPGTHDRGKMLVLPKSTSLFCTFHVGLIFCFFPANLKSSTNTNKNNPFSRCTNKHSQFGNLLPTVLQEEFLKLPFP